MPRVSRSRTIAAPARELEALLADPYNLPRWWPRCTRVEDVHDGPDDARWTMVLGTEKGRIVRADYRRLPSTGPQHLLWEQQTEATPFERILTEARLEIALAPGDSGTRVTMSAEHKLRGLSRLGSPMMRRGMGRLLDEALIGLGRALGGDRP